MDPQPSPSQLIHPLRYFLHHHGLHLRRSRNPGERGECGDAFKASSSGPRSTQELVWALPCSSTGPSEQLPTALPVGGHQSQRKPRFSSGTGKVAFNSQVPCSFLSKDSTLSRTLLTWNSEGWVYVPQISPGTSLAEYGKVIPKEVLNLRQHPES